MAQNEFRSLPTQSRCTYCGSPITYGADITRFQGDRFRYHPTCMEPAREQAIQASERALREDDLLPSERADILRGLRDLRPR